MREAQPWGFLQEFSRPKRGCAERFLYDTNGPQAEHQLTICERSAKCASWIRKVRRCRRDGLSPRMSRSTRWLLLVFSALFLFAPSLTHAQGGPPLLTNDPGTPGAKNWEINLAVMPVLAQNAHDFQLPQLDFNYGVGSTIQLTFEVPYVLQTLPKPVTSGWSNSFPGVKWRFIDNKKGWNVSIFPQMELNGPLSARRSGIAENATRFLLPVEVQRNVGPLELDAEAGYYFPIHGHQERIIGLAVGHNFTKKAELIGEIYNDRAMGALPHDTTWDLGGRYGFHKGLIFLFMAGRSFSGNSSGQPNFLAYIGVQILLEKNGLALHAEE